MFPPKGSLWPDKIGLTVVQNNRQFGHQPRPQLIFIIFFFIFLLDFNVVPSYSIQISLLSPHSFEVRQPMNKDFHTSCPSKNQGIRGILYQVSTPFKNSRSKLKFFTTCQRQMTKPRPLHKYPNQADLILPDSPFKEKAPRGNVPAPFAFANALNCFIFMATWRDQKWGEGWKALICPYCICRAADQ